MRQIPVCPFPPSPLKKEKKSVYLVLSLPPYLHWAFFKGRLMDLKCLSRRLHRWWGRHGRPVFQPDIWPSTAAVFSTPHALLPTRPSQCIWGLWVSSFLSWSVPPLNTVILYVSKSLWETGQVLCWICLTFYTVNPYVSVARDWASSVLDLSYFLRIKAWVSSQQETRWVLCWIFLFTL